MKKHDFYMLISHGDLEGIKEQLDSGVDVNSTSDDIGYLSHAVVCSNEKALDVCKLLIERGANVNAITIDEWSILYRACLHRNFNIVKYLLKKGADPKIRDKNKKTALDIIVKDAKYLLLFVKHADKLDEKDRRKIESLRFKTVFQK